MIKEKKIQRMEGEKNRKEEKIWKKAMVEESNRRRNWRL